MAYRIILISLVFILSKTLLSAPNIVVSIHPVHSIVSAITKDVTEPKLLLKTNQSAHHFHLKPSQLSTINNADLIVYVHNDFEEGLRKALANVKDDKKLTFARKNSSNKHEWLDVNKVQKFAKRLTKKLISIDKENASIYRKNLATLDNELNQLKLKIKEKLSPYKQTKIAIFSNAAERFILSNNLKKPIIVNKSHHDENISIKNILKAKKAIKKKQITCLLSENDAKDKMIKTLTEGTNIKVKKVDVIGFDIKQGHNHYYELMNNITNKTFECLQ